MLRPRVRGSVSTLNRAVIAINRAVSAVHGRPAGIHLIGMPGPAGNVLAKLLGFVHPALGFMPQPFGLHLGLFSVRPGAGSLSLPLPGVELHAFCFAADFSRLLTVHLVPAMLFSFPALARQKQQHDQRHHYQCNHDPYPYGCLHAAHHVPLDMTGPAAAGPADASEIVTTYLARVLIFY